MTFPPGADEFTRPAAQTVPYFVHRNDTVTVAQKPGAAKPYVFTVDDPVVWLSPTELARGESRRSTLTMAMSATTPEAQQGIRDMITDGDALQISITYTVTAAPKVATLATPSGTYQDIVGVTVTETDVHYVNATPAAAQDGAGAAAS
jgi:hypothetical protein